jgi:hypothetical protein
MNTGGVLLVCELMRFECSYQSGKRRCAVCDVGHFERLNNLHNKTEKKQVDLPYHHGMKSPGYGLDEVRRVFIPPAPGRMMYVTL